ncbi:hypothetical protein JCM10213_008649 [Rhodosporidiobolus nylandii]
MPTLSSLPPELKARIAEMCMLQDEAYRAIKNALVQRNEDEELGELMGQALDAVALDDLNGKSLGALFRVNKEWSEACAPYRFRTLKASNVNDVEFKLVFSSARGHHFQELHLDIDREKHLIDLFTLLPTFPNLCTVVIPSHFDYELFAPPTKPKPFPSSAFTALQRLSPRIRKIEATLSPKPLADALRLFGPTLRSLTLSSGAWDVDSAQAGAALKVAVQLEELRLLTAASPDDEAADFSGLLSSADAPDWPRIQTLEIRASVLHPTALHLAFSFSPSLRRLVLVALSDSDRAPTYHVQAFVFIQETFPLVETFTLDVHCGFDSATFASIEQRHFPKLQNFILGVRGLEQPENETSAFTALRNLASLKRLDLLHHRALPSTSVEPLQTFCAKRNIAFRALSSPPILASPFLLSMDKLVQRVKEPVKGTKPEQEYEHSASSAISFLNHRLELARQTKDPKAFARLVELLRPVELERLLWEA